MQLLSACLLLGLLWFARNHYNNLHGHGLHYTFKTERKCFLSRWTSDVLLEQPSVTILAITGSAACSSTIIFTHRAKQSSVFHCVQIF